MPKPLLLILWTVLLSGALSACKTKKGPCYDEQIRTINRFMECVEIAQPVCGCDGVTYANPCQARKNGISRYTMGPCNGN